MIQISVIWRLAVPVRPLLWGLLIFQWKKTKRWTAPYRTAPIRLVGKKGFTSVLHLFFQHKCRKQYRAPLKPGVEEPWSKSFRCRSGCVHSDYPSGKADIFPTLKSFEASKQISLPSWHLFTSMCLPVNPDQRSMTPPVPCFTMKPVCSGWWFSFSLTQVCRLKSTILVSSD